MMRTILMLLAALPALLAIAAPAHADPADIDAAARGVVRVVIIGEDEFGESFPVSHGTGFAVTPTRFVTNAHVVREAAGNAQLRMVVVPPEGAEAAPARAVSISPKNDLALIEVPSGLRLPPLTIAGAQTRDSGEVSAVGYPRNVDMAQGLQIADIFRAQPPVKSRGFISGRRPSRLFDTILHTAPIAAGNSGGPLLDGCGRVVGVNSFGADSGGADAEFFFAVSMRELVPFLTANGIEPRLNTMPCRSLSDLDAQERARLEREQATARAELSAQSEASRERRERARLEAQMAVAEERENAIALAVLAALAGLALIALAAWLRAASRRAEMEAVAFLGEDGAQDDEAGRDHDVGAERFEAHGRARRLQIAAIAAAVAGAVLLVAALALWFTRPGLDEIDRRVAAALGGESATAAPGPSATASGAGSYICRLVPARSRIVGDPIEELEIAWDDTGCVNGRTQYGALAGDWSRVFVPNEEDAVSVNSFDPGSGEFRTDRYLLGRTAMSAAREARSAYSAPSCGEQGAANALGDRQGAVMALLPDQPNERLVYRCEREGSE